MQLKRQSVEACQNEKPYSKENNTSENPIPRREIFKSVDHVKHEGQMNGGGGGGGGGGALNHLPLLFCKSVF